MATDKKSDKKISPLKPVRFFKDKCPNCGRNLTENELFCYFCEFEIKKIRKN